jgi:hypothetical protein
MFSVKVPYLHTRPFWWLVGLLDTRPKHGEARISFENGFREFRTPVFQGLGCRRSELLKKEGFWALRRNLPK